MPQDDFLLVKLPNGNIGKFRQDMPRDQVKMLINKDFPGTFDIHPPGLDQKLPDPSFAAKAGAFIPQAAIGPLEAAKKSAVDPFDKMAAKGAQVGGDIGEAAGRIGVPGFVQGMGQSKAGDLASGIGRGVGEVAGGMVADPRNWPLMGEELARPVLQKLMSRGFSAMMAKGTLDAASNLYQNWGKMTPQQRAEVATQGGLSALMTYGAATHTPGDVGASSGKDAAPTLRPPDTKQLSADQLRQRMTDLQTRLDAEKPKPPAPPEAPKQASPSADVLRERIARAEQDIETRRQLELLGGSPSRVVDKTPTPKVEAPRTERPTIEANKAVYRAVDVAKQDPTPANREAAIKAIEAREDLDPTKPSMAADSGRKSLAANPSKLESEQINQALRAAQEKLKPQVEPTPSEMPKPIEAGPSVDERIARAYGRYRSAGMNESEMKQQMVKDFPDQAAKILKGFEAPLPEKTVIAKSRLEAKQDAMKARQEDYVAKQKAQEETLRASQPPAQAPHIEVKDEQSQTAPRMAKNPKVPESVAKPAPTSEAPKGSGEPVRPTEGSEVRRKQQEVYDQLKAQSEARTEPRSSEEIKTSSHQLDYKQRLEVQRAMVEAMQNDPKFKGVAKARLQEMAAERMKRERGSFGSNEFRDEIRQRREQKINNWIEWLKNPKSSPQMLDTAYKMLRTYDIDHEEITRRMGMTDANAKVDEIRDKLIPRDQRGSQIDPIEERLRHNPELDAKADALNNTSSIDDMIKRTEGLRPGEKKLKEQMAESGLEQRDQIRLNMAGRTVGNPEIRGIKSPGVEELDRMFNLRDERGFVGGKGLPKFMSDKDMFDRLKNKMREGIVYHGTSLDRAESIMEKGFKGLNFKSEVERVLGEEGKTFDQLSNYKKRQLKQLGNSYQDDEGRVSTASGEVAARWANSDKMRGGEVASQIRAIITGSSGMEVAAPGNPQPAVVRAKLDHEATLARLKDDIARVERAVNEGHIDYKEGIHALWNGYVNYRVPDSALTPMELLKDEVGGSIKNYSDFIKTKEGEGGFWRMMPAKRAKAPRAGASSLDELTAKLEASNEAVSPDDSRMRAFQRMATSLSQTWDKAEQSLAKVVANSHAIKDWWFRPGEKPSDYNTAMGRFSGNLNRAAVDLHKYTREIKQTIRDPRRREAITNWIQAGGDPTVLELRALKSKPGLREGYEAARNLTPDEERMAKMIVTHFDDVLRDAVKEGYLQQGLENYVPQVWKKPEAQLGQINFYSSLHRGGLLKPDFNSAKKRIFESYFEGEQLGREAVSKDIGFLVASWNKAFDHAVASRTLIRDLSNAVAEDGRPIIAPSGVGKAIYENSSPTNADTASAYLIYPKNGPEETEDYVALNHPALRKWTWVGKDDNGAPIYMKGDLRVHPKSGFQDAHGKDRMTENYAQKLDNVINRGRWMADNTVQASILKGQSFFKATLLSMSPFHQIQLGLHALEHKVAIADIFKPPKIDLTDPRMNKLLDHGLNVGNYDPVSAFEEGLNGTGLMNKIPGIGHMLQKYTDYLFMDYIPRLKSVMGVHAFDRNMKRYANQIAKGAVTEDQIAELTANQANAAFGELNYITMGRNPQLQAIMRMMFLAPDFLEARARFVGQAVRPYGKEQRAALVRGALGLYVTARIVNQLVDGDPHWDPRQAFSLVYKGFEYKIRTIQGDMLHLLTDQNSFMLHRLNPVLTKPLMELATGKDDFGRSRTLGEQAMDFVRGVVPIPLQGFMKSGGQDRVGQVLQGLGVSRAKYRTQAAGMAHQFALGEMKEVRSHRIGEIVSDIDSGHYDPKKVQSYVQHGQMNPQDLITAMKLAQLPEMYRDYRGLPVEQKAKVFAAASPKERTMLIAYGRRELDMSRLLPDQRAEFAREFAKQ